MTLSPYLVQSISDTGPRVCVRASPEENEWPLANGLAEATEPAGLAHGKGALSVIGTQAIVSPELEYVRRLVADGFVGEVLSSTYLGSGFTWGDEIARGDAYAMDSKNGATLLSVIGGHTVAAIARNVAGIYKLMANDLRHGTHTAPDFDDALVLHMTLDAIERSSATGQRVRVG
ncbi:hypothetical protein NK8_56340 (plasmid) [Caballeronia sp. NK8]|nr:hypothetical protein NK8_56340 [Caballeronia sp. NK8]